MDTVTGIVGVLQVAITVTDLDRGIAFYRDRLGLSHRFTSNGMAFFDCGGVRLMLGLQEAGKPDQFSSIIYFRTEDIGQSAAALKARGVSFENEPALIARLPDREVWLGLFRDPDRNLLGLMAEPPASA
jgi:methylmalonyl-CoA/ethylmalonyl-CoA epimerase